MLVVAYGSNLGNRYAYIYKAAKKVEQELGPLVGLSTVIETAPWGIKEQPRFMNAVGVYDTAFNVQECFNTLQETEKQLGRIKYEKWGRRCIDLDILYFNNDVINSENIIVPHPLLQDRDFVLTPLAEILPDLKHPILKLSSQELLANLEAK